MKHCPNCGKTIEHVCFERHAMTQVDIYDLEIGDRFMEDTYPEIYKVTRKEPGTDFPLIIATDLETGEESEWGYHPSYFGPTIIKL